MNIIIAGIQGSGKGTQATKLAERYNLKHISTGDVLRKHIADKTEFGIRYESENAKGNLAPDAILFEIVKHETESLNGYSGYVLDGFPRTESQAEWVLDNLDVDYVFVLSLSESIADERMRIRGRIDDTPEAIQKRIDIYNAITYQAIEMLDIDSYIDANQSVDEVFADIEAYIDQSYHSDGLINQIINIIGWLCIGALLTFFP